MTASKVSRRVSLRVEAAPGSVEAKLLNYIREDPISPSRAVMLRALKAFYLTWALEAELSEADLKNLAQSAIEELQFRIFQIRQRYLTEDSVSPRPTVLPSQSANGAAAYTPVSSQVSIEDMRQSIDPTNLDDF
ncbi:MAG: hypothetical protein F6K42_27740 [Leptolyngbya sp. SIO1D8]|nr:hypothetical protein [Leptolyngbya sp. SIO1D8]